MASLEKDIATAAGIDKDYQGHPYLICTPQEDVVGGRNITVNVHGQKDDCETNPLLCGRINPLQWPTVREYRANIETSRGIRDTRLSVEERAVLVPYLHVAKRAAQHSFTAMSRKFVCRLMLRATTWNVKTDIARRQLQKGLLPHDVQY